MHSSIYQVWSEKTADNALSLAEESRLLFRAKRLSRAYYLAHMSIEESAKSILLHAMSVSGTPESEMPKVTKLLQDHKKKIEFLVTWAASSSEQLREKLVELQAGLVVHINDLKNNTMYVSCKGKSVYTPEEKVSSLDIEPFVELAEALSQHAKSLLTLPSSELPTAAAHVKRYIHHWRPMQAKRDY